MKKHNSLIKRPGRLFKVSKTRSKSRWKTSIDFTKIDKRGVEAREILKTLRSLSTKC
ncbi:MAG: hypothetical protein WD898_03540 [Candidatus Paceibacterota bacterium]